METETFLLIIVVLAIGYVVNLTVRNIRKDRYFKSDDFQKQKAAIHSFVVEHNELAGYVSNIRSTQSFALGRSRTGTQAHFADFQNTSRHNYRRDRVTPDYRSQNVHNCSLQVARNAQADPIKYVMKYFSVKADVVTLTEVERLNESITRLENAIENLNLREASITQSLDPPPFILKHYPRQFMDQVGVQLSQIKVPYPSFAFEYVSAGGNSSQRTSITFNTEVIDALIETIADKIKYRKSAAGQRALMTSRLREFIKNRDDYTCQTCSVSLSEEPHLLLEVDHIIPVSKGGLSVPENLQALCWKCNRTKSNKLEIV